MCSLPIFIATRPLCTRLRASDPNLWCGLTAPVPDRTLAPTDHTSAVSHAVKNWWPAVTSNGKTTGAVPEKTSGTLLGSTPRGGRFLKAVQRFSVIFVVVLLMLGAYLYFYASRQLAYLTERDLRALASMSTQIGTALESAEQIFNKIDKKR